MTQLVMSALPLMPAPTPTYYEFGRAVVVACTNLVALEQWGFTKETCSQVRKALVATGILKLKVASGKKRAPITRLGTVAAGSIRIVSAKILTSTKAPAAGVPVKFQMRYSRKSGWRTLATATTSPTGKASFTLTLNRSGYYRIVTARSSAVPYVVTPTRWVRVRPAIVP